ncbi:response regulator [Geobacter sulfurreducens]|uniref:response regulator n=1 Tax=Geobacter sulfurreducens TaxID=35554 RepID=UPI0001D8F0E1|nr:response regulator [Geobacter sulfurreducens]ADI84065.1 response receiver-related domain protein [Geobacter sulfurreducens KN400]AJY70941.1 histidine kinase [Geobacter sulfurreducens]QVW36446.1 response regulator [Geobacter sulfurreducens]UTG93897.1 response regulator [Geobacter sulfurreducens]BBA69755.1 Cyclic di-GMP phosphodiesterase response regulator RpfG [Geobacter sulfurreducens]
MGNILIVDDDRSFSQFLKKYIRQCFPALRVHTCSDPVRALGLIRKGDVDLLLVDYEMPVMDGEKVVRYACQVGMDRNRIIVLSSRDADYLHQHFPLGTCLAVMNKYEAGQKAVLDMVLGSLQRKTSEAVCG